jgi:hypothetical protein
MILEQAGAVTHSHADTLDADATLKCIGLAAVRRTMQNDGAAGFCVIRQL